MSGKRRRKHTNYARANARKRRRSPSRRFALRGGFAALVLLTLWAVAGVWFVQHPRRWLERRVASWPRLVTATLSAIGNPVGDLTDALGLTGHDAVYEYDEPAPEGEVAFAGVPRRTGSPAPTDITVLDRGEFKVGWSPKLRHPVWVAYHVPAAARFESGERPNFRKDKEVPSSPAASAYDRSGYDRGHMAPNYAIATRFGAAAQDQTFLMTNIAPQSRTLNRGIWRNLEHRIAELWTARYGEIWVIVGTLSKGGGETLSGTDIDVPEQLYQVVVAQEGMDIRAFAVLIDQNVPWGAWPTRYLITIDELEELTGLDFLPDLPEFIQSPLESELPSRLWPIRRIDALKQIFLRFR